MARAGFLALALAVLALSGCATAPTEQANGDRPAREITDPTDYSYLDEANSTDWHVHDYWDGQVTKVVMDQTITLSAMPGASLGATPANYDARLHPESPIIPGTAWVNVSLKWEGRNDLPADLYLEWRSALPASYFGSHQRIASGSSYRFSIPTNETVNDLPHSLSSRWTFHVLMDSEVETADVDIEITISRTGPVPPSPPHPDHWNRSQSLTLHDQRGPLESHGASPAWPNPNISPSAPHIVPPMTQALRIELLYNSSTPAYLHWRPVVSWLAADRAGFEWEQEQAPPDTSSPAQADGAFEWTIAVEPRMWDSPYASQSGWKLQMLWQSGQDPGPVVMSGDFHVVVYAQREPYGRG